MDAELETVVCRLVKWYQPASLLLIRPQLSEGRPGCEDTAAARLSEHYWQTLLAPAQIMLTEQPSPPVTELSGHIEVDIACLVFDVPIEDSGKGAGKGSGVQTFEDVQPIIARWRDTWSKPLWAGLYTADRAVVAEKMRALGFSSLSVSGPKLKNPATGSEPMFFSYSIQNYKSVPEWLNARYWANPERWDIEQER